MKFVDRVRVHVRAGDGGRGVIAWRREAHTPKGGPAGGDGGRGGDVIFVADQQVATLLDLRFRQHIRAEPGRSGGAKGKHGRGASDLEVRVPVGTAVYFELDAHDPAAPTPWRKGGSDPELEDEASGMETVYVGEGQPGMELEEAPLSDEEIALGSEAPRRARSRPGERPSYTPGSLIGDLEEDQERLVVAYGGRGGRGNLSFKSGRDRAPDKAEFGEEGEARWLRLELKLLADVGLVGFPNVGKSTLIRAISRARPEVGAYPFTTLTPQLGMVSMSGERDFVVADVPGLIEGAAQGRGLGHEFLRHLERTRVLVHLLAPDPTQGREPLADLDTLEKELSSYGSMFEGRPRVVALNKIDTPEGEALVRETRRALRRRNIPLFPICAQTGEGVEPLLEAIWRRLEMIRASDAAGSK